MSMAMAAAVSIALMAHRLVIIERRPAQCRMVRMAARMTIIIECTMAVERQHMDLLYNNRHYHTVQQILWRPLLRQ